RRRIAAPRLRGGVGLAAGASRACTAGTQRRGRETIMSENEPMRIGIDLGGTKIAAVALLPGGGTSEEIRVPTPRDDYDATLEAIRQLVLQLESDARASGTVGVGMPGSISPATGRVQNSNSTWLNGQT